MWLDKIVDNLIARGLEPWMCLCYGNKLYSEDAAKVFGAVGVPPIFTDEQKNAWRNYVKAVVARYNHDETAVVSYVNALRALCKGFNDKIVIIHGESGSQSRSGGCGAVKEGAWTPKRQAKQLLRHTMADLMAGVEFTSYFSCMDMIEALNGRVGDVASYTDFGYFGVFGADFDEEGHSIGTYTPKMSYWALQTISSIFAEEFCMCDIPVMLQPQESLRFFGFDCKEQEVVHQGFAKPDGSKAFVYWYPSNILTTDYEATVTLQVAGLCNNFKLIDLMDGSVYNIPEKMIEDQGFGCYKLINLPIKDYPMLLSFDNFADV